MKKYFFNVFNANGDVQDEEGVEVHSVLEAKAIDITGIRSLMASEVANGLIDLHGRIEIVDAHDKLCLTVTFGEAVTVRGSPK